MKKKMIVLLAAAMMTLSASSAFAAFGVDSLTRYVYGSTFEVGTDLGTVQTLIANGGTSLGSGASAWSATYSYLDPADYVTKSSSVGTSGLYVAYMAMDANGSIWISANAGLGSFDLRDPYGYGQATANLTTMLINYNSKAGSADSAMITKLNSGDSYYGTQDGSFDGSGDFSTMIDNTVVLGGTMSLTGTVTQGLYMLDATGATYDDMRFHEVATIVTNADGSTTVIGQDAAPVPIPAAAYLLGSGLLGLVGIRRKQK